MTNPPAFRIAILALEGASSSTIAGPADVLLTAAQRSGLAWQLDIVSARQGQIKCGNGITLLPSALMGEESRFDLVIIPALPIEPHHFTTDRFTARDWVRAQYGQGARIASICSGAFLLAETGILDGKDASTSWELAEIFRSRFPRINLRVEETFVDNGKVLCSSANGAWQDLLLHILSGHLSHSAVAEIARAFQIVPRNMGQKAFSGAPAPACMDERINAARSVLQKEICSPDAVEMAVRASGMPPRTFQRQFKAATSMSAGRYLQTLRVRKAKELLTASDLPVEDVCYAAGYNDPSRMRRVFKREAGLTMREYRQRFSPYRPRRAAQDRHDIIDPVSDY